MVRKIIFYNSQRPQAKPGSERSSYLQIKDLSLLVHPEVSSLKSTPPTDHSTRKVQSHWRAWIFVRHVFGVLLTYLTCFEYKCGNRVTAKVADWWIWMENLKNPLGLCYLSLWSASLISQRWQVTYKDVCCIQIQENTNQSANIFNEMYLQIEVYRHTYSF